MSSRFIRSSQLVVKRLLCPPRAAASFANFRCTPSTNHAITLSSSSRSVHATPTVHALRRRSRRSPSTSITPSDNHGGDDDDNDDENENKNLIGYKHSAVTDETKFVTASTSLIDKLFHAISPMERVNDPFFLTRGYEEEMGPFLLLDLGPVLGQYIVQVDLEETLVTMTTPRTGQIAYILSESTNAWVSIADGHALEGMLVRELIHQAQGVPNL